MNIFVLDKDIVKCAQYHTDRHICKMITETAQILCSAYYSTDQEHLSPYKKTHYNHPSCVWARQSLSNWVWLHSLGIALYAEYKYRYNSRTHKAGEVLLQLKPPLLLDIGLTPFPQAMPDEYKSKDAITAYRAYYNGAKRHLFKWTKRNIPEWITA